MPYAPISINREALTIMGVPFPSLEARESAAAIGSNMFEGYEPTKRGIEIIRDYTTGKISFDAFIRAAVDKGVCGRALNEAARNKIYYSISLLRMKLDE